MNEEITAKPKQWGNSIGIIIPSEIIEKNKITLKDELILRIEKKKDKKKHELMKEGCLEMAEDAKKINKEWESADEDW